MNGFPLVDGSSSVSRHRGAIPRGVHLWFKTQSHMKRFSPLLLALAACTTATTTNSATTMSNPLMSWAVHDPNRPQPPVVTPGPAPATPMAPPSDAIVLFDGRDLAQWVMDDSTGSPAKWKVGDGWFEVVAGTGTMRTRQGFGDVQLHIEWMAPNPPRGEGQDRGNSGVFLMGRYEVQVLDTYGNRTYPDGQAGAVYGQYPPLVNASRPPGEWQTYDIAFRAPRFDAAGAMTSPARITLLHNGVLVQDAVELTGPSGHRNRPPYQAHEARLPLSLQDHDHPVRFRNVWVRELKPLPVP
jgi:hypothetical protein